MHDWIFHEIYRKRGPKKTNTSLNESYLKTEIQGVTRNKFREQVWIFSVIELVSNELLMKQPNVKVFQNNATYVNEKMNS